MKKNKSPFVIGVPEMDADKPDKPKRGWRARLSSALFFGFCLSVLGMFGGLIYFQATRYNELRAELDRIQANIDSELLEMQRLQTSLDFFDSDAYVERLAREVLGMVYPGEIVFRNVIE